jgi:hypothetical protein
MLSILLMLHRMHHVSVILFLRRIVTRRGTWTLTGRLRRKHGAQRQRGYSGMASVRMKVLLVLLMLILLVLMLLMLVTHVI